MATNNAVNQFQAGIQSNNGLGQIFGRFLTGSPKITVTNGSGVTGNPTISLPNLAGTSQVLGSSSTSTAPVDLTMGPSTSITGTTLNSGVSFFNGTSPLVVTPTDRPATTNLLYIGTDGSLWVWNGTTYVQYTQNPTFAVSNTVPAGSSVTLQTISVRWSATGGNFQLQCSTSGGVLVALCEGNNGSNGVSNASVLFFQSQNTFSSFTNVQGMTGLNVTSTYPPYIYAVVCDIVAAENYIVCTLGPSSTTSATFINIRSIS